MNIIKDFNYVLSEDTRFDITKLRPVIPGDEYYLVNEVTKEVVKVGDPEIKKIFTHTIKDLDNILDEIVKTNLNTDFTNNIKGVFQTEVVKYFNEYVKNLNILKYCGEKSEIPESADVGSIVKVGNNWYLFYEENKYKQIITIEYIDDVIKNFYTKEEIDKIVDSLNEKIADFKLSVLSGIEEIENVENNFVTRDEFIKKISEYEKQINSYRESYEKQIDDIKDNYDIEVAKINDFRERNESNIINYTKLYDKLKNRVDDYQQQIDSYASNISDVFGDIELLSSKLSTINSIISGIQNTLDEYSNLVDSMNNTINDLTNKVNELMKEDQKVIG